MNLLALDTSSSACSVALQVDKNIRVAHVVKPREHTALLIPMIDECLSESGISFPDLDGIVLGNGPGSFIGMRIAASVAQGIAFAAGLKIVPVSSLAAVAAEALALHDGDRVLVAQDAHMNEVYLAEFVRDEENLPLAEGAVTLHKVTEELPGIGSGSRRVAGAGWHCYPELLETDDSVSAGLTDIRYPNARYLLALGRRAWSEGHAIPPENVVPEYVRMTVAAMPKLAQT